MIKNDINLIQKRKGKQYSSKSVAVTLLLVVVLGVGIFLGITLPSKNLAQTRAAVSMLDSELQQYNAIALSATESTDGDTLAAAASIDTLYIEKSKTLNSLEEQLESLTILATAESNALVYINAIEESIPKAANVSSLTLAKDELNIYGAAVDDAVLAEFSLKLRECGLFNEVFVVSSMSAAPSDKTCVFNITAILTEPLNTRPAQEEDEDATSTTDAEGNQ